MHSLVNFSTFAVNFFSRPYVFMKRTDVVKTVLSLNVKLGFRKKITLTNGVFHDNIDLILLLLLNYVCLWNYRV